MVREVGRIAHRDHIVVEEAEITNSSDGEAGSVNKKREVYAHNREQRDPRRRQCDKAFRSGVHVLTRRSARGRACSYFMADGRTVGIPGEVIRGTGLISYSYSCLFHLSAALSRLTADLPYQTPEVDALVIDAPMRAIGRGLQGANQTGVAFECA